MKLEENLGRPGLVRAFRDACAHYPTGVVVVATECNGAKFGTTVNAFTSLSLSPPQLLICLSQDSRTCRAIRERGDFTVNVLSAQQAQLARLFASKASNKFDSAAWRPGTFGSPLLEGAVAWLECLVVEALLRATHSILIGSVVGAQVDPSREPLLFFCSRLQTFNGQAAELPTFAPPTSAPTPQEFGPSPHWRGGPGDTDECP